MIFISHPVLVIYSGFGIGKDTYFSPDQGIPDKELINRLLKSASGPVMPDHPEGHITPADLAKFLSLRRAESKRDNPQYTLTFLHSFFMYGNATVLYEIMGGDVKTGKSLLLEERIPEGFETL